ncbi:MAG: transposase [Bacteroidetes bacterium]|nr:transposase [Bacteroidota bacterium]
MICILHTWGPNHDTTPAFALRVVPGGGLTKAGNWKGKIKRRYLFPVKAMSKVFRAKYMEALKENANA